MSLLLWFLVTQNWENPYSKDLNLNYDRYMSSNCEIAFLCFKNLDIVGIWLFFLYVFVFYNVLVASCLWFYFLVRKGNRYCRIMTRYVGSEYIKGKGRFFSNYTSCIVKIEKHKTEFIVWLLSFGEITLRRECYCCEKHKAKDSPRRRHPWSRNETNFTLLRVFSGDVLKLV